jgi:raffinose/stachyose/melibiose transport system substrate-binding protein
MPENPVLAAYATYRKNLCAFQAHRLHTGTNSNGASMSESPTTKSERLDMTQHRRSRAIRTGVFATVAAGALVLAGCSGSGSNGNTSGGSEEFSLSFAVTNSAVKVPYQVLAEKYMEENPNVKITMNTIPNDSYGQTLTTQLNAGNASDAFQAAPGVGQTYSVVTLAKAGLLAPLDDAATKVVPAGSESQFQVDGKTYAVALGLSFVGAVLNSTQAKAAGTEYPTDWDSLLSTCKDLSGKGKALYVLAGSMPPNTGLMAMAISATRVYAENPKWNDDRAAGKTTFADTQGWKDTLDAIVELNKNGCFQKGVEGAGFDAITAGILQGTSLAAFIPSNSAADLKQNAADQDFLVEQIPAAPGGKAFGIAGADYSLALNAKAKNAAAAKKFVDWSASEEGQKVYADAAGSLPLGQDLSSTIYAPVADVVNAGDFVPLPNSSWPNSNVYDALGSGVQGLLTGQKTVDDVLKAMDAAWG